MGHSRADPTETWRRLMAGPESAVMLDESALLVAAHARPGLDLGAQLGHLDQLAEACGGAGAGLDEVVDVLFRRLELRGNATHYDDPDNSYLDQVLERRLGIPISLSVVLIEVARRCGLRLEGVGMPGHFLVRDPSRPLVLIDAFGAGRRLDPDEARGLFEALVGPGVAFDETLLAPSGPFSILARILTNLDRSYRARGDIDAQAWVTTLRAAVPGLSVPLRLELSSTLTELGRIDEAIAMIEDLLREPDLPEAASEQLRRRAVATRAHLN